MSDLYVKYWYPEGEVRATMQIVHGIAEYVERYDEFANFMAAHGILVVGDDHPGHGKSIKKPEDQGFFAEEDGWFKVVGMLKEIRDEVAAKYPGVPHILFGHSMGSFLARTYIIKYPSDFDACILSGTGNQPKLILKAGIAMANGSIKKHGPRYVDQKLYNMSMGGYAKGFEPDGGPCVWLSRDRERVKKYENDPLCGWIPTASLMRDMMSGIDFITTPKNLALMNKDLPVYFMSGADDPVGEKGKGVRKAFASFQKAGMKDVEIKLYPGGRHEMLNEINRDEVCADILKWVEKKI